LEILINMEIKTRIHTSTVHHLQKIIVRIHQAAIITIHQVPLITIHHLQVIIVRIHQAALITIHQVALITIHHLQIIMELVHRVHFLKIINHLLHGHIIYYVVLT
jgi:hypothetical protein